MKLELEKQKLDLLRRMAGAGAPRAARKTKWLTPSTRRRLMQLAVGGVVVAALNDKHGFISLVITTLGATVSVVDATASASVQILQAGGNATVAATSIFVEALSVSSGIADDAWRGIDLHQVRAGRRVGKLLVSNMSMAQRWLATSGPGQLGSSADAIASSLNALQPEVLPFAEFEDVEFDPQGKLTSWRANLQLRNRGARSCARLHGDGDQLHTGVE